MITAGDERGRTQRGNNNAYVPGQRDRPGSTGGPTTPGSTSTTSTKTALRLRREHPALRQRHFFEGRPTVEGGPKDLAWIHPEGREMTEARLVRRRGCTRSGCSSPATRCARPARGASSCTTRRSCCGSTPHADAGKATLPANEWVQHGRGGALHRRRATRSASAVSRRRGARPRAALAGRAPPAADRCGRPASSAAGCALSACAQRDAGPARRRRRGARCCGRTRTV